jgi:ABC-type antimicrobial peptide transport system permease subunit
MGVRLIAGRYFDSRDAAGAKNVVIIDESVAHSNWPGESALGKTIHAEHMTPRGTPFEFVPSEVVGVVEHVRNHSITKEVRGEIYSPFEQNTRGGYPQTFVLRTSVEPLSLVPAIRALLKQQNPDLAMDKIRPMVEYINREIAPVGFTAMLAAIFGGLALLLAATGIYGVLNYQISRRLPEMGIRIALGASARNVLWLVVREAFLLSAAGVLLGASAALSVAHWLGSLLYGVTATDPVSYGLALLLLGTSAFLGCWFPARRAASANPAQIIRED